MCGRWALFFLNCSWYVCGAWGLDHFRDLWSYVLNHAYHMHINTHICMDIHNAHYHHTHMHTHTHIHIHTHIYIYAGETFVSRPVHEECSFNCFSTNYYPAPKLAMMCVAMAILYLLSSPIREVKYTPLHSAQHTSV